MRRGEVLPIEGLTEDEIKNLTPSQRFYRRHREYVEKWNAENKEHLKLWRQENYKKNKAKINERSRNRYSKDIQGNREKAKEKRFQAKQDLIYAYGGKCACCGEERLDFLTLDHVNNNGAEERRKFRKGEIIYRHLRANGYPREGYQILCWNCNLSKHLNHGKCIHQIERENNKKC